MWNLHDFDKLFADLVKRIQDIFTEEMKKNALDDWQRGI